MSNLDFQTLFIAEDIADDGFSAKVTTEVKKQQQRLLLQKGSIASVLVASLLLMVLHFDIAETVSQALTTPIFNIQQDAVRWVLSPINNIGALLVLLLNFYRLSRRGESGARVNLYPF